MDLTRREAFAAVLAAITAPGGEVREDAPVREVVTAIAAAYGLPVDVLLGELPEHFNCRCQAVALDATRQYKFSELSRASLERLQGLLKCA